MSALYTHPHAHTHGRASIRLKKKDEEKTWCGRNKITILESPSSHCRIFTKQQSFFFFFFFTHTHDERIEERKKEERPSLFVVYRMIE